MTSTATPSAPPIVGEGGELAADGLCTVDPCGRKPVAIIGGTGYVGRLLARRLLSHPTFCLGPIVGSSMSEGLLYRDVWERKEHALVKNYGTQLWSALDFPPELEGVRVSSLDALLGTAAHVENRHGARPRAAPCRLRPSYGHISAARAPIGLGRTGLDSNTIAGSDVCSLAISCVAPDVGYVEDQLVASGFKVFSISPYKRMDNLMVLEVRHACLLSSPPSSLLPLRCARRVGPTPHSAPPPHHTAPSGCSLRIRSTRSSS